MFFWVYVSQLLSNFTMSSDASDRTSQVDSKNPKTIFGENCTCAIDSTCTRFSRYWFLVIGTSPKLQYQDVYLCTQKYCYLVYIICFHVNHHQNILVIHTNSTCLVQNKLSPKGTNKKHHSHKNH